MKESFIFYSSFFEAICDLDDKKRLKMYDAIANLALKNEENITLNGICKQLFILIKPQILANNKRYEVGKKGAIYGKLGGRPKKEKTPMGFSENTPNVNENENENENVNVNEKGVFEKEKKSDPYISKNKTFFIAEYDKIFNTKPFLSAKDCNRLNELASEYDNIRELIPEALSKLKAIEFKDIDFTPSASWLLKGDNFERVMNGEFDKKTESIPEWMQALRNKDEH